MASGGCRAGDVRRELKKALYSTQRGSSGTRSARQLWEEFLEEDAGRLAVLAGWAGLVAVVEQAFSWDAALAPGAPQIDRAAATRDLAAVSVAIKGLIEEMQHGP